ncbi:MAG TPA: hypothetical protein PLU35_14650 [Phycisphaerales bacterium]|nr:hypothetical protein [Phycisphaerales bacterium]
MRIVGRYSFKNGERVVAQQYAQLLREIEDAIGAVDARSHKTKASQEKTMPGRMLFNPIPINRAFKDQFGPLGWNPIRVRCDHSTEHYVAGYEPKALNAGAFREMDFVKGGLGVEV